MNDIESRLDEILRYFETIGFERDIHDHNKIAVWQALSQRVAGGPNLFFSYLLQKLVVDGYITFESDYVITINGLLFLSKGGYKGVKDELLDKRKTDKEELASNRLHRILLTVASIVAGVAALAALFKG